MGLTVPPVDPTDPLVELVETPALPGRLQSALAAHARWGDAGIHLVGVRHHSPGCAAALAALLEEVRPSVVLIEGPREYGALLPALADERTKPPVAILSVGERASGFYPLADFSPEWVALRWGMAGGATVDFIDASYADIADPGGVEVRTLQAEHHLARSALIAAVGERLGCRDHDETWEHLFEVRSPEALADWRRFFADTLAWGAMARLDADRELLDADGTHAREAVMAAILDRYRDTSGGVVVVTGAFHTLAMLDVLENAPEAAWVRAKAGAALDPKRDAWLIRYDFDRLDGLRGYGAGMPAPGFWQRAWQARSDGVDPRRFATEVVLEVAARLRAAGEPAGSATALDAVGQALRLAELRGRGWPGRTDLTDALLSCFVKDDLGLSGAIGDALRGVFGGPTLGQIPDGLAAPPLVAEARREASRLRFVIDDATLRQVSLDTQRKPSHVKRREFLARMRFIGSGFARQLGGADLVQGTGAGLLFEDWEYAWTPLVEAALIAASARGATIAELVRAGVAERLDDEHLGAGRVARLITELLVMGEPDALRPALDALRRCYDDEVHLGSVVASLHALVSLSAEQGRLSLGARGDAVAELIGTGLACAAHLIAPLSGLRPEDQPGACDDLIGLRSLLLRLVELVETLPVSTSSTSGHALRRELRLLRRDPRTPARLHGCLLGLGFSDAELDADELARASAAHLAPGADPERVADFVLGLLQAAPDLLLHTPELVEALNTALGAMEPEAFLTVLPDLRRAFTWLKPTETHALAAMLARLTGAAVTELDTVLEADPLLAERAASVERDLVASLRRDGLTAWVAS
ncbi:DUF5682 family protein [Micropruina sp.]|uniref:DUF5682 family protein n=1 Tax=Micropruina sp. TaxID=2737536 RepID=UPI00262535D4|nr:DUF5682 family protein [Micropruina sp.]